VHFEELDEILKYQLPAKSLTKRRPQIALQGSFTNR
jgi:hypothetical protein